MGPFVAAVLSTLVALVVAVVHPYAEAQSPPRMSRVGFLSSGLPAPHVFRDDLQQLGYVEGRNLVIISRSLERHGPRLPELAAELIGLKVDVIVTADTAAIRAASQATNRIPSLSCRSVTPSRRGSHQVWHGPVAMSRA
jgi:putative ABC transport system substrate-binding protein